VDVGDRGDAAVPDMEVLGDPQVTDGQRQVVDQDGFAVV
jgi:hypothetical protein